jgi:hypothetical protein
MPEAMTGPFLFAIARLTLQGTIRLYGANNAHLLVNKGLPVNGPLTKGRANAMETGWVA